MEQNGTTHYDNLKYPSGVWTNGIIRLLLNSATSGKIHLGYNSGNVGSAGTPKLFVDEVKVESYDDLIASLRYIVGDVNNDKQLNISDVVALVNIILNPNTYFNPLLANVNARPCSTTFSNNTLGTIFAHGLAIRRFWTASI